MSNDTFTRVAFPSLRDDRSSSIQDSARATGHAAGYLEGLRAGAAAAVERAHEQQLAIADAAALDRARLDAAIASLNAAATALEQRTIPLLADAQGALAAAAVDIAEAVIAHELSCGDASARSALDRALGGVEVERVTAVRLNPDDLADLNSAMNPTSAALTVNLVADASLSRGDAITEFDDGFLDARIGQALGRVRAALAVAS